jgi:hypothetical protein
MGLYTFNNNAKKETFFGYLISVLVSQLIRKYGHLCKRKKDIFCNNFFNLTIDWKLIKIYMVGWVDGYRWKFNVGWIEIFLMGPWA